MRMLVLTILLFSYQLLAQEKLNQLAQFENEGKVVTLYKGIHDSRESLVVFNGLGAEGNYELADSAAQPLKKVSPLIFPGTKKLYIVSIWAKGAHGEAVRVLDPEKKNMEVMKFKSSWPVTLEVKDSKLVIHGKGDMIEGSQGEYEDLNYTWSPAAP